MALANGISISSCEFLTGDDAIALSCPEGYTGDISRVTVTNCKFNSPTLIRLYTIGYGSLQKLNVDNVTVSNCSGTLTVAGFAFGDGSGSNPRRRVIPVGQAGSVIGEIKSRKTGYRFSCLFPWKFELNGPCEPFTQRIGRLKT